MKIEQEVKNRLGIAGEYRVLSELLLKGHSASITTGNAKGTDIIVFKKDKSYLRIEVKTSKNGYNFVTSYFPKYSKKSYTDPDFWILHQPRIFKNEEELFFILTHNEVRDLQLRVNKGNETKRGQGVDNIPIKLLNETKNILNAWGKIK